MNIHVLYNQTQITVQERLFHCCSTSRRQTIFTSYELFFRFFIHSSGVTSIKNFFKDKLLVHTYFCSFFAINFCMFFFQFLHPKTSSPCNDFAFHTSKQQIKRLQTSLKIISYFKQIIFQFFLMKKSFSHETILHIGLANIKVIADKK